MKTVYEIRDVSDDERYFSFGIFSDKESALNIVRDIETAQGCSWYADEGFVLSVFEHQLDSVTDNPTEVFKISWLPVFPEDDQDDDEERWESSVILKVAS